MIKVHIIPCTVTARAGTYVRAQHASRHDLLILHSLEIVHNMFFSLNLRWINRILPKMRFYNDSKYLKTEVMSYLK